MGKKVSYKALVRFASGLFGRFGGNFISLSPSEPDRQGFSFP